MMKYQHTLHFFITVLYVQRIHSDDANSSSELQNLAQVELSSFDEQIGSLQNEVTVLLLKLYSIYHSHETDMRTITMEYIEKIEYMLRDNANLRASCSEIVETYKDNCVSLLGQYTNDDFNIVTKAQNYSNIIFNDVYDFRDRMNSFLAKVEMCTESANEECLTQAKEEYAVYQTKFPDLINQVRTVPPLLQDHRDILVRETFDKFTAELVAKKSEVEGALAKACAPE